MFNDGFREVKMGATFHVTTRNAETGEIEDYCSTKNTILVGAYQYMASGAQGLPVNAGDIYIGEGGTEPNENQTGLESLLAGKPGAFSRDLVNPLKWYWEVYFSSGEANGTGIANIREVGAKWPTGPFLNRALFRDSDGITPRTITKTSSQVLTVRMEFEIKRSED